MHKSRNHKCKIVCASSHTFSFIHVRCTVRLQKSSTKKLEEKTIRLFYLAQTNRSVTIVLTVDVNIPRSTDAIRSTFFCFCLRFPSSDEKCHKCQFESILRSVSNRFKHKKFSLSSIEKKSFYYFVFVLLLYNAFLCLATECARKTPISPPNAVFASLRC